jgi:hypothetical protein
LRCRRAISEAAKPRGVIAAVAERPRRVLLGGGALSQKALKGFGRGSARR